MANKKYDKEEGVWRTIGGRRVFIRTGQSLSSAMRDSGKFKRMKEEKEHYRKTDEELRKLQEQANKDYDRDFTEARKLGSDKLELEAKENRKKRLKDLGEARLEVKKNWEERLAGKEYIDDYPEAYRHYERDYESTQWVNDSTDLRKEFGLGRQDYPEEKDYMPGGKRWNPEWASSREAKFSKDRISELRKAGNDSKLMSRDEYESYASRIPNRKDYASTSYDDYVQATKDVGVKEINQSVRNSVRNYDQVDKEWTDLAKKMEKDYDEFGTTNWKDEKRLNELSAERDRLSVYRDDDRDDDGGVLRDTALQAFKNGDISKKELADGYLKGKQDDGGVLRDTALEAYKNGDISLEELKRDYLGVKEKKTPYNSKAYAKELSQVYMAEEEYDDKITPKYIQDIDSARYGDMSDEDAIKEWLDGGADIVYVDDARAKLKEWGIPVKNDDPYGTYRDELAKQLLPIYKEDKRVLGLKQRFKGTYEDLKDNTNMSEAEILEFLKKLQNK